MSDTWVDTAQVTKYSISNCDCRLVMMCNRNCFWVGNCICLACLWCCLEPPVHLALTGILGLYCANYTWVGTAKTKVLPRWKSVIEILRTDSIILGTKPNSYIRQLISLPFHGRIYKLCMVSKVAGEKELLKRRCVIVETLAECRWVGWMFSMNGVAVFVW